MPTYSPIIKKALKTIKHYGMIDRGDRILVAVSGGPDSVCLLDILHELSRELETNLIVAHYNHGLRPSVDDSETHFVRNLARTMNLPFETETASLLRKGPGESMEERARIARYGFLERLQDLVKAGKIAVGHNLNDQAETVIMRLLRGSGPSGLTGIPPVRDNRIIRPLIEIKREEIEHHLSERGLSYVIDRSNYQTRYLRNKIRLELMPSLLKYQPKLVEHLGQMAEFLRHDNLFLDAQADVWIKREVEFRPGGDIMMPVGAFTRLMPPVRDRVTRQLLLRIKGDLRRIGSSHIGSIVDLALGKRPQGILNLPEGILVKKAYQLLIFSRMEEIQVKDFQFSLDGPGRYELGHINRTIVVEEVCEDTRFQSGTRLLSVCFDADRIQYPLVFRNFRPGDRFIPLGMDGRKKVKDFFIDLKIPREIRYRTPLLLSRGRVVWVCGFRIDERYKVSPETERILKVTIE